MFMMNDTESHDFGNEVKVKRAVGRPPKYSHHSDSDNEDVQRDSDSDRELKSGKLEEESPVPVKRPRGRPPKSPLTSTEKKLLVKFKKRRGRPPNPEKHEKRSAAPSGYLPGTKRRGRPPGSLNKNKSPKVRWPLPKLTESVHTMPDPDNTILRLTGRHFPDVLPEGTNLCQVCFNNSKEIETAFCCSDCSGSPPLCAYPCFGIYHTVFRYWQTDVQNGPSQTSESHEGKSFTEEDDDDEAKEDEDDNEEMSEENKDNEDRDQQEDEDQDGETD